MANEFQTKINQLSLVMTISEDIVKACKKADLPPAMTEVLLRLHHQQVEMEKAINSLRTIQLQMAHVVEMQANVTEQFSGRLLALSEHTGYDSSEKVSSEDIGQA